MPSGMESSNVQDTWAEVRSPCGVMVTVSTHSLDGAFPVADTAVVAPIPANDEAAPFLFTVHWKLSVVRPFSSALLPSLKTRTVESVVVLVAPVGLVRHCVFGGS